VRQSGAVPGAWFPGQCRAALRWRRSC